MKSKAAFECIELNCNALNRNGSTSVYLQANWQVAKTRDCSTAMADTWQWGLTEQKMGQSGSGPVVMPLV